MIKEFLRILEPGSEAVRQRQGAEFYFLLYHGAVAETGVGKSIVHCADCGKAIREDDFLKGTASTVDSRSYCSSCRPVLPPAPKALDLRKNSTAKMPMASPLTPRKGTPALSTGSRTPLIVGGVLLAAGILGLVVWLSGRSGPAPALAPIDRIESSAGALESAPKTSPFPARTETPAQPSDPGRPDRGSIPEAPAGPAAKPAAPEKSPPPPPRLTDPQGGSTFDASAEIPIEAEARDPEGRIVRVEFWQGTTKLGETNDVPYRMTWKGARSAGTYELKAKSIDRSGAESASAGVQVTIRPEAEVAAKVPGAAEPPAPPSAEAGKDKPAPAGKPPEPRKEMVPPVDQKKIDLAVKKGLQYLVGHVGKIAPAFEKEPTRTCHPDELLLWTFIHAGVPESSTPYRYLFKAVTEAEIRRTYEVALQAMILEEVDRVRYQERLQQCAQFLADNQCANGQWSYGEPPIKDLPTVYGALPVPTAGRAGGASLGEHQKPPVIRKLKVTPRRNGPAEGDNSNSQYAALGIRACADAGILFPDELLVRARKWFRGSQHAPEGAAGSGVATEAEPAAPPAGWCYASKYHGHGAYGSMTAGAIGGIAIYDTLLGEDWRKDAAVASGLSWMARNFSVTGNPGPPSEVWAKGDTHWSHYYYLYALERSGVLCRTEWMGRHAWYPEGATVLLAAQGRDGAWNESPLDTCFAILFLKRATRPLEDVASTDDRSKK